MDFGLFSRTATFLANKLRLFLCKINKPKSLRIDVSIEAVTDIKPQVARFLFDLCGDHWRHLASFHLITDHRTEVINDGKPTIPTTKTPTHAGFSWVAVPISEDFRVALAKQIIDFLSHYSL
ncbi:MAG: hypothetical protein H7172_07980, partial [Ferruginibacter sp.]|nr:hypothetical protein [Rhodoferax sp.]